MFNISSLQFTSALPLLDKPIYKYSHIIPCYFIWKNRHENVQCFQINFCYLSLQLWQAQKIKQVRCFIQLLSLSQSLTHTQTTITIFYHLWLLWCQWITKQNWPPFLHFSSTLTCLNNKHTAQWTETENSTVKEALIVKLLHWNDKFSEEGEWY